MEARMYFEFNMGWQDISKFYPERQYCGILPTTDNIFYYTSYINYHK